MGGQDLLGFPNPPLLNGLHLLVLLEHLGVICFSPVNLGLLQLGLLDQLRLPRLILRELP